MIVLILVRPPERTIEWKLEFLSSIAPKVVHEIGKAFVIGHFIKVLKLFVEV